MPDPTLAEISHDTPTPTHPGVPPAPTGLRVGTLPDGRLELDWDPAPGVDSWDVLDVLNTAEPFKENVTVPRSIRSVLQPGTRRRYAVQARNAAGVSPLSNTVDVPASSASHPTTSHPAGTSSAPASVLDLSRWSVTMPVPKDVRDPSLWNVYQPELANFSDPDYFRTAAGPSVEYIAPTRGAHTPNSKATRCELREMAGPSKDAKAAWSIANQHDEKHTLTCTLSCDGTSIVGRKEVIVGQIHGQHGIGPGQTPPLILSVNHDKGGALEVYLDGHRQVPDPLSGLRPGELFTYRIEASGSGVRVWAARGEAHQLPSSPRFSWPASKITEQTGLYFKAGAYNKQEIETATTGQAIVRHHRLDLA